MRIGGGRVAGTTLTLSIVGAPPVEAAPSDPRWRGYDAEVTESDREVQVLVREQLPDVHFPPGQGMSRMGHFILLPVNLARPLADRLVIDLGNALPVPVVHGLLTANSATDWTLRSEHGGSTWVQQFTGPAGDLVVTQGPSTSPIASPWPSDRPSSCRQGPGRRASAYASFLGLGHGIPSC